VTGYGEVAHARLAVGVVGFVARIRSLLITVSDPAWMNVSRLL
jgi:hypothetical protein